MVLGRYENNWNEMSEPCIDDPAPQTQGFGLFLRIFSEENTLYFTENLKKKRYFWNGIFYAVIEPKIKINIAIGPSKYYIGELKRSYLLA